MIYYFSGTGNSLHVARQLADALGERLCPMTWATPPEDESIGLVFPVYAWGIPKVVELFVRKHSFSSRYVYCVMTCGDDMGFADRILEAAMGRKLDAAFSVLMPNIYVCLPGFDVDDEATSLAKLSRESATVSGIAADVRERRSVRRLRRGTFPRTKTYLVRPLFNRYLVTDKYFVADRSKCVACGRCSKQCPVGNILIIDDVPQWQHRCVGCLACYHSCGQGAIRFGSMTKHKGHYNLQALLASMMEPAHDKLAAKADEQSLWRQTR